jgi:CubicO group peptidase (beta-lactamase class C family)
MNKRVFLSLAPFVLYASIAAAQDGTQAARSDGERLELSQVLDKAGELPSLKSVIVAREGEILAERGYRGHSTTAAANIKSASKIIISALVGIAIDKGVLEGPDQKIAPLLKKYLPVNPDPRIEDITIGNLLSMQAGLGRTSGPNYGRWVSSRNWVRSALAQPFVDEPGGPAVCGIRLRPFHHKTVPSWPRTLSRATTTNAETSTPL